MISTTTFFAALDQIDLPPTSSRGDRFADVYNLTTDRQRIAELVRPVAGALGTVETSYLTTTCKAVAYRISERDLDPVNAGRSLDQFLIEDMLVLREFQRNLWLMKDNSVHFDRAWIAAETPQGTVVNNNTWMSRHSCADGSFRLVAFDSEELRTARKATQGDAQHLHSSATPTFLTSDSHRFQRFQYFVDIARSSIDVAMKIAQYCSGLEAMVSTAQTELSHQVSERVAATIAEPGERRIAVFKQIKEAYGFRSKAVHGASFKPKDAGRLRDCATHLDEICREIAFAYLDTSSGFREAIEESDNSATEYFLRRTLGAAGR